VRDKGGKGREQGRGKRGDGGKGGEMTQTLYAHMNKIFLKRSEIVSENTHMYYR
jgi:hypothetical protein